MPSLKRSTRHQDFQVGDFRVEPSRNRLIDKNKVIPITPRMMAVLCVLAQSPGDTVSRDQLFEQVWGSVVASDEVLSRAIADLRKVLNDSARQPQYIETITKIGYRLVAQVNYAGFGYDKDKLKTGIIISGAILIIFISWFFLSNYFNADNGGVADTPTVRLLTFDDYRQRTPRFSPDGTQLVYRILKDGNNEIFINNIVDGKEIQITKTDEHESFPVFSPGGDKIIFRRFSHIGCRLILLDLSSKNEKTVGTCPRSTTGTFDWSPDGRYLVMTQYQPELNSEGLALLDLTTGDLSPLLKSDKENTGYLFPRFSANGRKIAFAQYNASSGQWAITVFDIENKSLVLNLPMPNQVSQVAWGKSGKRLFFTYTGNNDKPGLWQLDLESQQMLHLYNTQIADMDFDQTNNRFAIIQKKQDKNIWRLSYDGKDRQKIVSSAQLDIDESISPDGSQLAFISNRQGTLSLWLKNLSDNSEQLLLESNEGYLRWPSWMFDGKSLLVHNITAEHSKLFDVNLNGEFDSFTLEQESNDIAAAYIHDKKLLWSEKSNGVWSTFYQEKKNTKPVKILDGSVAKIRTFNDIFYFTLHGDKRLFYFRHQNIPLAITEASFFNSFRISSHQAWDLDKNNLFFLGYESPDSSPHFMHFDINEMQVEPIYKVDIEELYYGSSLTLSPTTKHIYYTQVDRVQQDVALISFPGD